MRRWPGSSRRASRRRSPLVAALQSQNPALRAHAAEMLGWIKPNDAVQPLATALKDSDAGRPDAGGVGAGRDRQPRRAEGAGAGRAAGQGRHDQDGRRRPRRSGRSATTVGAQPAPEFGDGFLSALSNVPATSWTFFALFLALALALLLLTPRARDNAQPAVGRRPE